MELSLCMIVRNEEAHLAACLDSVKDAVDEIVILDTGSTDATMEIARRYTDRVISEAWHDDFARARNSAFSYATKPYLMWMDADDELAAGGGEKLRALKPALDGSVDAVMMPYHCALRADGKPSLVFDRERIVRREAGFRFEGAVHEAMAVSGCVIREEIPLVHTGCHGQASNRRNLAIYGAWEASGRAMSARDRVYYARELMTAQRYAKAERLLGAALGMACYDELRIDALMQSAVCRMRMDDANGARAQLLCALAIDTPRAEALCLLGECEMLAGRDRAAAAWYRAAMTAERPGGGAFVQADCYDYLPAMQLCVLYDRMGRTREAAQMNELALVARPGDAAAEENRRYFSRRLAVGEDGQGRGDGIGRTECRKDGV